MFKPRLSRRCAVPWDGCGTPTDVPPGPVYPANYLTQAAKVLYRSEPQLPERLRKRGIDGYVMIDGIIGTDGRFHAAHVTRYDVHSLIEPALENIAQWRFEPARIGDMPVNAHFEFVIEFRADHAPPPTTHTPSE